MSMSPRFWCWTGVVGVLLVALAAVLGWVVFPYAVNMVIGQMLALQEGSDAWDRWVELPIDLDMKLSIFNVTNKEEIMRGAKPKLQEVGPYVYKQHRRKYDISVDEQAGTVSYHQSLIHTFSQELSGKFRPDDVVTVVNPALLSLLGIMQNIPVLSKGTMFVDAAAPLLFPDGLFVTTTADQLLFRGVRIPCSEVEGGGGGSSSSSTLLGENVKAGLTPTPRLAALITCSSFKRIKLPTVRVTDSGDVLFALFMNKNNTYDGRYTVRTGVQQPERLAQITAWQGKPAVSAWGGPTCNAINGTQGDIFSPYLTKDSIISVFSTDICRSMSLKYVEDTEYRGIRGYRFSPGPEVMASAAENGDNYCFCPQAARGLTKENGCLRRGALDLSGCQGIPVVITYPHFYMSDPFYLDGVEGLNPRAELHRMQLDIEPMTGTPLLGGKKMQLNFQMKQVEGVMLTKGLRDTLFPVAWMYEGAQLNTELIEMLNGLLFSKLTILDAVKYCLLALGSVMFLSGTALFVRARRRGTVVRPDSPRPRRSAAAAAAAAAHAGGNGANDVGLMPPPAARRHGPATATAETRLQAGANGGV